MIQNGQVLAVFNSAHRVMKAEQILKDSRLAIKLIPAPRALSTDCGLAIQYDGDIYDRVLDILNAKKLLPASIYLKESDALYKEIWSGGSGEDPETEPAP